MIVHVDGIEYILPDVFDLDKDVLEDNKSGTIRVVIVDKNGDQEFIVLLQGLFNHILNGFIDHIVFESKEHKVKMHNASFTVTVFDSITGYEFEARKEDTEMERKEVESTSTVS